MAAVAVDVAVSSSSDLNAFTKFCSHAATPALEEAQKQLEELKKQEQIRIDSEETTKENQANQSFVLCFFCFLFSFVFVFFFAKFFVPFFVVLLCSNTKCFVVCQNDPFTFLFFFNLFYFILFCINSNTYQHEINRQYITTFNTSKINKKCN